MSFWRARHFWVHWWLEWVVDCSEPVMVNFLSPTPTGNQCTLTFRGSKSPMMIRHSFVDFSLTFTTTNNTNTSKKSCPRRWKKSCWYEAHIRDQRDEMISQLFRKFHIHRTKAERSGGLALATSYYSWLSSCVSPARWLRWIWVQECVC